MSQLEDQFKEMIRGLPCDDQFRDEHLKSVCSLAMSEFENAGSASTKLNQSRFRFARRHVIRGALAASLLASVSLGVVVYRARPRQAEPGNLETVTRTELARLETQLIVSLQTVDGIRADHNPTTHDRAVDACLTWHLSRAAEIP